MRWFQPKRTITEHRDGYLVEYPENLYISAKLAPLPGSRGRAGQWLVPRYHADTLLSLLSQGFVAAPEIVQQLEQISREMRQSQVESAALDGSLLVPGLVGELRGYQQAGVKYLSEKGRALLGDAPGVGKTLQALATVQLRSAYPCLVVAPATVLYKWADEVRRWFPSVPARILDSRNTPLREGVTICSYHQMLRRVDDLYRIRWAAVVADESHNVKSFTAQRTQALHHLSRQGRGGISLRLLLSGTAIRNRPEELAPQLDILGRLGDFGGLGNFLDSYCRYPRSALHQHLRAVCYLRREKEDVLTELPPVSSSVVPLDLSNRDTYQLAERDLFTFMQLAGIDDSGARSAQGLVRINTLRQLAARGKLKGVVDWVSEHLDTGEKLVTFVHHRFMAEEIANRFRCGAITGDTPKQKRHEITQRFQADPSNRLVVCSLDAASEGIDLYAAHHVALAELPWTPAQVEQAVSRVHRLGQHDPVTLHYLVAHDTVEERMAMLLDSKRRVVGQTLSGQSEMWSLLGELRKEVAA